MFNPFTEIVDGDATDTDLVEQAKSGDRAALEELILRHQAWIYNIAVRMVFQPEDAEEVTQEVLVKVMTQLSTFQGKSKFRTWLYRIVANHVLNMKRSRAERQTTNFADYMALPSTARPISTCLILIACRWTCRCWSKKPSSVARRGCCFVWIASSD